jgi:hypothetical protein
VRERPPDAHVGLGVPSHRMRTFMSNGSGVSRGDRNRNARLSKLRGAVPGSSAIVGIDLADRKQVLVVTDHDSKVLARRTVRCTVWDLGAGLDWAHERAARAGFMGVTVACEPTGQRWRILGQLAGDRGMSFVCVQPMLSAWGAQERGPDHGQGRREGRGDHRPPDRAAALLPARTDRRDLGVPLGWASPRWLSYC